MKKNTFSTPVYVMAFLLLFAVASTFGQKIPEIPHLLSKTETEDGSDGKFAFERRLAVLPIPPVAAVEEQVLAAYGE